MVEEVAEIGVVGKIRPLKGEILKSLLDINSCCLPANSNISNDNLENCHLKHLNSLVSKVYR